MADGASSAADSPDGDSDLGRTHTATGQKKRSLISQTAAQREERLAVERLLHITHVPCHIHQLAYCMYSHFPPIPSLLLLIYQIHNLRHD